MARNTSQPTNVVTFDTDPTGREDTHMRVARAEFAKRLAQFRGSAFAGEYDRSASYDGPLCFLPSDTLVEPLAAELGIRSEEDLFGGVVRHPFVATKVISHPLVEPSAVAPPGWSEEFGRRVRDTVLSGISVFTHDDAQKAGALLLARGPVRTKPAQATSGRDQNVVANVGELKAVLDVIPPSALARFGLVIEENLTGIETYSVGQVRVAGFVASYHGTQRLTRDNEGEVVYGGSDLVVARGGFEALLELGLEAEIRLAVSHARTYDAAAFEEFSGLFASRRNYDVIAGLDAGGHRRVGVLEQSWRFGGASAAEIGALEAFRAEPGLAAVRASTFEAYGQAGPPQGAILYYRGSEERIGPMCRYAMVEPYVDA